METLSNEEKHSPSKWAPTALLAAATIPSLVFAVVWFLCVVVPQIVLVVLPDFPQLVGWWSAVHDHLLLDAALWSVLGGTSGGLFGVVWWRLGLKFLRRGSRSNFAWKGMLCSIPSALFAERLVGPLPGEEQSVPYLFFATCSLLFGAISGVVLSFTSTWLAKD